MTSAPAEPAAVPTGNTFDKYGSTNPVVRRLMAAFEGTLADLFDRAAPRSVLDLGCGEGVLTHQWAERLGEGRVGEFDLVAAIEVLEHVPDPAATLAEMARVARTHLLVSVPREPLWRGLNIARGAYLRELGNTPGHINHFSKRAFIELLGRYGTVLQARSPFPWTMLLVRADG
jgi:2-polyprenyl-3-methyl-5-hydroxy-6-metoxy-1,4-benzoquinol methylase